MGQAFHHSERKADRRESARRFRDVRVSASPREDLMGAKRCMTVFCFVVVSSAGVWAADNVDAFGTAPGTAPAAASSGALPSSTGVAEIEAWIHTRMDVGLRQRVEVGFEIAVQRVEEVEACAELFHELGADATETLSNALYWPVISYRDRKELCGRKTLAFTFVGSRLTFICPDFEGVSDQRAAQIIIHEALHNAGLEERPQYTGFGAKSPAAIDSMVATACEF
jgi:hypothetical protein